MELTGNQEGTMDIERIQQKARDVFEREYGKPSMSWCETINEIVQVTITEYQQQATGVLTDEQAEAGAKAGWESVCPGHSYERLSYFTKNTYRDLIRAAAPHVQYAAPVPSSEPMFTLEQVENATLEAFKQRGCTEDYCAERFADIRARLTPQPPEDKRVGVIASVISPWEPIHESARKEMATKIIAALDALGEGK